MKKDGENGCTSPGMIASEMLRIPTEVSIMPSPELAIPTVVPGRQIGDVTAVSLGGVNGTVDSSQRVNRQLSKQAEAKGSTRQRVTVSLRMVEDMMGRVVW